MNGAYDPLQAAVQGYRQARAPDVLVMPDGSEIELPPGATDADKQRVAADWLVEADRRQRVETAGNEFARTMPPKGPVGAAMDEFGVNFTGGLTDLAGAAITGVPGLDGGMEDLDFWERRDALRHARGVNREASGLPGWADVGASVAGAVTGFPGSAGALLLEGAGPLSRVARFATGGAIEGGAAGAGNSDARSLPGLFEDTLLNAGVGAAVGTGLQMGTEAVGGVTRGVYGRPGGQSREAFERQEAIGYRPTFGSVGNERAMSLESALGQYPLNPARLVPGLPTITRNWARNEGVPEGQVMSEIEQYLSSPAARTQNVAEFNANSQGMFERGARNLEADRAALGDELANAVPAREPTTLDPIRRVPEDLRAEGRGVGLIDDASREVSNFTRNPRTGPVDAGLDQQLGNQINSVDAQLQAMTSYRQRVIGGPGVNSTLDAQISRLEQTRAVLEQQRQNNLGIGFRAALDERSNLGRRGANEVGLDSMVKDRMYAGASSALEDTASRVGAGDTFREVNARFRQNYADDALLSRYTTPDPRQNFTRLKTAFTKGAYDEIDTLARRLDPEDWSDLRGNFIHHLGSKPANPRDFDLTEFRRNWDAIPDEAKLRLVPDDKSRAVLDAVSAVAEDVKKVLASRNSSNSALQGGVIASFAVKFATFAGLAAKVAGTDAALASRMAAQALAGKPNELNALVKTLLLADATRTGGENVEQAKEIFPEIPGMALDAARQGYQRMTGGTP